MSHFITIISVCFHVMQFHSVPVSIVIVSFLHFETLNIPRIV
jgi:hypothetical protein